MGAPHQRERVFIIAYPNGLRRDTPHGVRINKTEWQMGSHKPLLCSGITPNPHSLRESQLQGGISDKWGRTSNDRQITPNPQGNGRRSGFGGDDNPVQQCHGAQGVEVGDREFATRPQPSEGPTQSRICGMDARLSPWVDGTHPSPLATGIPHYQKRLKALGNTVVPQCAAIAYQRILEINNAQSSSNPKPTH
jgi:hypothetical protein